jgi:hypothetical protein
MTPRLAHAQIARGSHPDNVTLAATLRWLALDLEESSAAFGPYAEVVRSAAQRLRQGTPRGCRGRRTSEAPVNLARAQTPILAARLQEIAADLRERVPDFQLNLMEYAAARLRGNNSGPRGRRRGDAVSLERQQARRYLGGRVIRWTWVLRHRYRLGAGLTPTNLPKITKAARARLLHWGVLRQIGNDSDVLLIQEAARGAALTIVHDETRERIAIKTLQDCAELARRTLLQDCGPHDGPTSFGRRETLRSWRRAIRRYLRPPHSPFAMPRPERPCSADQWIAVLSGNRLSYVPNPAAHKLLPRASQ